MKIKSLIIPLLAAVLLALSVSAAGERSVLYSVNARSGIGSVWKTNSNQSWGRVCTSELGVSGYIFSWYNNSKNQTYPSGGVTYDYLGLPPGEAMKLYVPRTVIAVSQYRAVTVEFEYGVYSGDGDNNIASIGESAVFVSTDNGANYTAASVPLVYHELTGEILTTAGEANGVNKPCIMYRCVSGDLKTLVPAGSVITNIMIKPYGDSTVHSGALRVSKISVYGYTGVYTPEVSGSESAPKMSYNGQLLRDVVTAHVRALGSTAWTTDATVKTNNYNANNSDMVYHQYYEPGITYYGPTYARPISSSFELFTSAIGADGKYTGGRDNETVYGMDCANVVMDSISRVTPVTDATFLACWRDKKNITPVGDLVFQNSDNGNTATMRDRYTKQEVYEAYSKLLHGDIVFSNPYYLHVRLVGGDAVTVRNGDGTINETESYVPVSETAGTVMYIIRLTNGTERRLFVYNVYTVSTATERTTYAVQNMDYSGSRSFTSLAAVKAAYPGYTVKSGSSIRIDRKVTFKNLYDTEYIGFTLPVYSKSEIECANVRYNTLTTPFNIRSIGLTGVISSNYKIYQLKISVKDKNGAEAYGETVYPLHNAALVYPVKSNTAALSSFLSDTPQGIYRCTVKAYSGPYKTDGGDGTETVLLDLWFRNGTFEDSLKGDVTGDGACNILDLITASQMAKGIKTDYDGRFIFADYSHDDTINISDCRKILEKIVNA